MKSNQSVISKTLVVASLFMLRMLGLFMVIPIFTLFAPQLTGATPVLVGIAFGIYGLSQALLQIPLGMLSDRIGRKRVLTIGFIIFAIASIIGAMATNIYVMIGARFFQGAAAIGSTLIALVSDITTDEERTRAMAVIGMSIGLSFFLAILLGPIVASHFKLNGVFVLSAILALIALVVLQTQVPTSHTKPRQGEPVSRQTLSKNFFNPKLARLNFGIFSQHAIFTATFFALPLILKHEVANQWRLYLPVMTLSFFTAYPLIMLSEKKGRLKMTFLLAIVALGISQFWLSHLHHQLNQLVAALFVFFTGFNLLEATLPATVSKVANSHEKGTVMGIYSSCQFLGIFFGAFAGGKIAAIGHIEHIFLFNAALALVWFVSSQKLVIPGKVDVSATDPSELNTNAHSQS